MQETTSIDLESLEKNVLNYTTCSEINSRILPTSILQIGLIDINKTGETCETKINKRIIWDVYDLDISIPFFKIHTSLDCDSSVNWRWIFRIKNDRGSFSIDGIKLYLLLVPILLAGIIYTIKDIKKTNSVFDDYVEKKDLYTRNGS